MAEKVYIELSEAKRIIKENEWKNPVVPNVVNMILDRIPAADVVEVRHGEWQQLDQLYCSLCGVAAPFLSLAFKQIRTPYCHRCGAKMDGGKTE